MKIKIFLLGLACSCFGACAYDPATPYLEVENSSGIQITMELYFDNENYKPYWSTIDFRKFLLYPYGFSRPGPETALLSTDTSRLIQRYLIPNNSTYCIEGWGDRDDVVLYNKLRIFKADDTLSYNSLKEMKSSFERLDEIGSRLIIK